MNLKLNYKTLNRIQGLKICRYNADPAPKHGKFHEHLSETESHRPKYGHIFLRERAENYKYFLDIKETFQEISLVTLPEVSLLLVQLLPEHGHLRAQRRALAPQARRLLLLFPLQIELDLLQVGEDLAAGGALAVEHLALRGQPRFRRLQVGHLLGQAVHLELRGAHLMRSGKF